MYLRSLWGAPGRQETPASTMLIFMPIVNFSRRVLPHGGGSGAGGGKRAKDGY